MARKSIPSENPIRQVRIANHKTLESFSFECGVSLQAVYLNECGVYPGILPSIERRLVSYYECVPSELIGKYIQFVERKRYLFGEKHSPYVLPDSDQRESPIFSFRKLFAFSRIGFAKKICVQPTLLYKVEQGKIDTIPGQIVIALREIQLPVGDIEELQERYQEFLHYHG